MRSGFSSIVSAFLSAAVGISCSPKTSSIDITRATPSEIIQKVTLTNRPVGSFRARGTISIESPEFVGTGTIAVSMKRPDSVLIKIEGPFGIDIGSMLLTASRFTYYDSHTNRVITGATTRKNIRSLLKVDLDFEEVLDLLSGVAFLSREVSPPDSLSLDDDQLLLYFRNVSTTSRYWIEPDDFVVVRYEVREDSQGHAAGADPILETRYGRFSTLDSRPQKVRLPRSISVLASRQKRGIALYYENVEIDKPKLDFSLKVPSTAKRIYW